MKARNFVGIFLLLLCVIGLTTCHDKDEDDFLIWDFYPIILQISVQDAQGNDLLNPETEGNIAEQGIKAIYKDEIYMKDSLKSRTKAYLAVLEGLRTCKDKNGKYYLTFGEFNGDDTFDHEQVVIDWNDGTKDTLSFSSELTWKSKREPVINREFFLNGEKIETEYGSFVVTKEPGNP